MAKEPKQRGKVTIGDVDASTGAAIEADGAVVALGGVELKFDTRDAQEVAGAFRRIADRLSRPQATPLPKASS